jgi:hypothetical protein
LQAVLNASIGLLSVGVSLAQVWAVKHAIDVASGTLHGSIYLSLVSRRLVEMASVLVLAEL